MELYCKACGETIEVEEGQKTVVCDFCGLEQTLPQIDSPEKVEAFMDANEDRLACKFDVAKDKYEKLIELYPDDNEAYWGKLLCIYGIEYVDDNLTEKKLPTCHRTLRESIFDNADYQFIISRATDEERAIYEAEAAEIDRIQKEILEIADKSEPYDIFICYKESDSDGRRTKDSQIASKIYNNLTNKGYKVFFSKVTLKGMAGAKYEPVIYSALISSKVMLLVANSAEYVDARWVRNEWSRYLEFMREDDDKIIVPCIGNMDAYDLPKELSEFQALNTTDMDFTENLIRQINSKFGRTEYGGYGVPYGANVPGGGYPQGGYPGYQPQSYQQPAPAEHSEPKMDAKHETIQNYLNRAKMFLSDKDWERANEYAEKILDMDFEFAEAYLVKVLCHYKRSKLDEAKNDYDIVSNNDFTKAVKFASGSFKAQLNEFDSEVKYQIAMDALNADLTEKLNYDKAIKCLNVIKGYKDVNEILDELPEKRSLLLKEKNYNFAQSLLSGNLADDKVYNSIISYLQKAGDFKDAELLLAQIPLKRQDLIDSNNYESAIAAMNKDLTDDTVYNHVVTCLHNSNGYKDAEMLLKLLPEKRKEQQNEKTYKQALLAVKKDLTVGTNYDTAVRLLEEIKGYKNADAMLDSLPSQKQDQTNEKTYNSALSTLKLDLTISANYEKAQKLLKSIKGYKDADKLLSDLPGKKRTQERMKAYDQALVAIKRDLTIESNYDNAVRLLNRASGYKDANSILARITNEKQARTNATNRVRLSAIFGLIAAVAAFVCTFFVGTQQTHLFYYFSSAWDRIGSNNGEFMPVMANISGILFTLAIVFFNFLFGIKAIVQNIKGIKSKSSHGIYHSTKSVLMYLVFALLFVSVDMTDASYTEYANPINFMTVFGMIVSLGSLVLAIIFHIATTKSRYSFKHNKGFYVTGFIRLVITVIMFFVLPWSFTIGLGSDYISYTSFSSSFFPMINNDIEAGVVFDALVGYFPMMMMSMMMLYSSLNSLYEPCDEYSKKHNITFMIFAFLRMIFQVAVIGGTSYSEYYTMEFGPVIFVLIASIVALVFTIINCKLQENV